MMKRCIECHQNIHGVLPIIIGMNPTYGRVSVSEGVPCDSKCWNKMSNENTEKLSVNLAAILSIICSRHIINET